MKTLLTFKEKMNEMYEAPQGTVADAVEAAENSGHPAIIVSEPGMGKNAAVKQYAEQNGYKFVQVDAATISMEDIQLPKRTDDKVDIQLPKRTDDKVNYAMAYWWPKEGEKTLLYVDEIDRASNQIKNFFLQMIIEPDPNKTTLPQGTTLLFGAVNLDEIPPVFANRLNVVKFEK